MTSCRNNFVLSLSNWHLWTGCCWVAVTALPRFLEGVRGDEQFVALSSAIGVPGVLKNAILLVKLMMYQFQKIRVKQRSCFYHLPDSLPMKHAFQGLRGTWFIHAEACPWSDSNESVKGLEKGCLSRNGGDTAEERELSAILENHSETLSEWLSVSGIIKKYFSDYEEVSLSSNFTSRANQSQRKKRLTTRTDSNCSKSKVSGISQFMPKTPPRVLPFPLSTDLSSKTSRNIVKRTGVGHRLVVASNNLGISVKSATGLCRFGDRKLSVPKSSSFVRSIVFEISDSDE
ncbi:hypothetical protein LOK49_LG06G00322 [Camellia lanceoleosa]|uniref:Uncharacterized protein n=1 Tax=Camellia lanceoleosa TaxID=1840588 RepID=A0ACC0HGY8_9ERIC|nr:hypothetical protein LOK49_LG06G00322 [Camellia lanceoleosa]